MDDLASVPAPRTLEDLVRLLDDGAARKRESAKPPPADEDARKDPPVDMRGGMSDLTSLPTQRTSDSVERPSEQGSPGRRKAKPLPRAPESPEAKPDEDLDFEPEPDRKLDVLG
jgi:hypothetical protein